MGNFLIKNRSVQISRIIKCRMKNGSSALKITPKPTGNILVRKPTHKWEYIIRITPSR